MENIEEKVQAFDKATSTIQKKPWAAIIVILVVYTYACYYVIKGQFESQIEYLTGENNRINAKYDNLTTELLIKNNVIDKKKAENKELMVLSDSLVTEVAKKINK